MGLSLMRKEKAFEYVAVKEKALGLGHYREKRSKPAFKCSYAGAGKDGYVSRGGRGHHVSTETETNRKPRLTEWSSTVT